MNFLHDVLSCSWCISFLFMFFWIVYYFLVTIGHLLMFFLLLFSWAFLWGYSLFQNLLLRLNYSFFLKEKTVLLFPLIPFSFFIFYFVFIYLPIVHCVQYTHMSMHTERIWKEEYKIMNIIWSWRLVNWFKLINM